MSSPLLLTAQYPSPTAASVGGLYTHTGELRAGLQQLGCRADVLTLPAGRFDGPGDVSDGVHRVRPSDRVLSIPLGSDGQPTAAHLMLYSQELVQYARQWFEDTGLRPALLHVHDYFLMPAALQLRSLLGIPVVLSVHMLHDPLRTWWGAPIVPTLAALERTACLEADAVIAVSQSVRQLVVEHLGVAPNKAHVVHNGFDSSRFSRPAGPSVAAHVAERVGPGSPLVVFAGRLTLQKGVLPLVRALRRVVAEFPELSLALAGVTFDRQEQTDERRRLLDELDGLLAEAPDLRRHLRPLGNLTRDELAALYQRATVAVVPSVYEPFGYAAVEAMAAACPVIASDVGGLPEIIDHERTGLLIPVHRDRSEHQVDEAALTTALLRVCREPAWAARLASAGAREVAERFTAERMASEMLAVYRSVADVK